MIKMNDFLKDCFQKIGWEKDHVSFVDLPLFLKSMAYRFPFENRAVLANENYKVTKEELWRRLVKEQHGGLCYDLNGFLYFVLREAGFHVKLIRGTVYAGQQEEWALEGTHAAVFLSAEKGDYIVDIGFGINLALQPIPLSGETVQSPVGSFRIKEEETEKGSHVLLMDKGEGWQIGYAFTLEESDAGDLDDMKDMIHSHEKSPFNKSLLASKLTPNGRMVMSDRHFTIHENGSEAQKSDIGLSEFEEKLNTHFL
ncbi:arylamine N-acetyltransferase family protein [Bacillus inaquosorum]|uniref:arylamine N-acetyltransferase family protein n=1 Tax=Bacillus inaquosorum TaxID=483913 RepID=UPI00227EC258|nr:arylamine N-acetyltransferase [Bacillus inaquosorum]MCY7751343.1 arylamine N-acetyltransferase [Bacillus inaquosorum]MCY7963533.1 arylamine N-acetyltransferase [Bacillus inaquosorum]MCY8182395.1 arylamine N-acetyltransferase [Bacillus inaquosorum]MCY8495086.1 arylamine N-acetyltransferase [Bacillus inaquosorum]MCY8695703.1 arylamine N-acetyltransferase [Bacillus inaquosorum]